MKRTVIAIIVVYAFWSLSDLLIHKVVLQSFYLQTAELWRPAAQSPVLLGQIITCIIAGAFVGLYYELVEKKSLRTGMRYGAYFGIAAGFSLGSLYFYQPIPALLASLWVLTVFVQCLCAGAVTAMIVKMSSPVKATPKML